MEEIKVVFVTEEDGFCEQRYKVLGKDRFYIRSDSFNWYTATDYGERNGIVRNDITFIICDPMGKELFSTLDNPDYPFLKETCKLEWKKIGKEVREENNSADFWIHTLTGDTSLEVNKWLLSFKDPGIYGKEANDYDENWTDFRCKEISRDILHHFNYCGINQQITRIQKEHTICHVTWYEYYSGGYYMAAEFDYKNIGTMYAAREAKLLVKKKLREIYGEAKKLSLVSSSAPHYEYRMTLEAAVESLLEGNYNRKFVHKVINNEAKKRHFYTSKSEIEAIYGKDYIPYFFTHSF